MPSQVFYRKWRPQTLAEVAGQEHITTTLANALATGRVAHAYLFCGPRGTGKTSTGRILAKAVNCLQNGKGDPCNTCQMCQAITEGRSLDLIEIDAASNRGIDEIRNLREKVNFAPHSARYKVYIIDEVHMLTEAAFNALLKTLEEPPPHIRFVLATTEVYKVPATILSRCQRFDFRRIPMTAVVKRLRQIAGSEGIKIEDDALGLTARSATGSLRDAENMLEQLVTYYGSEISLSQVKALLGITGDARIQDLAQLIASKDLAGGLATINSISEDGLDLRQFVQELTQYLRGLLLIKSGVGSTLDVSAEALSEMRRMAQKMSLADIANAIKLFGQVNFRSDAYSTLPLELALVDYALSAAEPAPRAKETIEDTPRPAAATPSPAVSKPTPPLKPTPSDSSEAKEPLPPISPGAGIEQLNAELKKRLKDPPAHVRKTNAIAWLRSSCRITAIEGNTVVLEFKHKILKEGLEATADRHIAEEVLSSMLGAQYKVRCVLASDQPVKDQPPSRNHLIKAAMDMGARIVNEE